MPVARYRQCLALNRMVHGQLERLQRNAAFTGQAKEIINRERAEGFLGFVASTKQRIGTIFEQ